MSACEDRVAAAYVEACLRGARRAEAGQRASVRARPRHGGRRTSFAAPRRAPLRSRRRARGSECASAPPSRRPSRRSVRTPISASSFCARRSRRPRRSPDAPCARRWRACSTSRPRGRCRRLRRDRRRQSRRPRAARPRMMCSAPPTVDAARGHGGGGGARPHRAAVRHGL